MAHVLIIEDDRWMADCYAQWLQADGHTVQHAYDAQDALDALDGILPQVILLDLFLPYANGIQFLQTLRSHADLSCIPVVLCSTALPANLPALKPYGVAEVVDKTTISPRSFRQIVRKVITYAAV